MNGPVVNWLCVGGWVTGAELMVTLPSGSCIRDEAFVVGGSNHYTHTALGFT